MARELDYETHLAWLSRIDAALSLARCRGALLKGALLAHRLYARPSARGTTDIDLLVDEHQVDVAAAALSDLGYRPFDGPREAWFREHHHHVHFVHPHALPLELHFHAYRGFGTRIPSGPLLDRGHAVDGMNHQTLTVLAKEDELVYLAVHAAGHRFSRLAWLYDCKLLLATMDGKQVRTAVERATHWGVARPFALAAALLVDVFGVPAERLSVAVPLGWARHELVRAVVAEPPSPVLRSATRFAYTGALAPSARAAVRYAWAAAEDHVRRLVGGG
jgi:hypothetical protein